MNQAYMGIGVSAIAALPIGIVVFIVSLFSEATFGESIVLLFSWGFYSFIFALLISTLYGAPIYLALRRVNFVKLPVLLLAGVFGGAVFNNWAFPTSGWQAFIAFSVIGAYCSFAFWYGAEKLSVNKANQQGPAAGTR